MKVLKFGGTSLKDINNINAVIKIITKSYLETELVIIVSAIGGVTDALIDIAKKAQSGNVEYFSILENVINKHLLLINYIVDEKNISYLLNEMQQIFHELRSILIKLEQSKHLSQKTLDHIMSFGERLSALIITSGILSNQINAKYLDSRKIIKTDRTYGEARINFKKTNCLIKKYLNSNDDIKVVTGFIASTENGETTTLGRNGSDYTATVIGAALNVESIEIWSDVDGIMTADPNIIPKAISFKHINLQTALEYSRYGAKIIFPKMIEPILKKNIKVLVKNTLNPKFSGTLINSEPIQNDSPQYGLTSASTCSIPIGIKNKYLLLFNSKKLAIINLMSIKKTKSTSHKFKIEYILQTFNINILDIIDDQLPNCTTIIVNKYDEKTVINLLHSYFVVSAQNQHPINNKINGVNP